MITRRALVSVAAALLATAITTHARADEPASYIPEGGERAGLLHGTIDATATYGIGAYSALGVQLHGVGQVSIWNTRRATGTFDFGGVLGYQNEPQFLQYAVAEGQTNDAHRLNTWATLGTTFHLGQRRRSGLGLHLFGGWTHVWSSASLVNARAGINRSASDDYGLLNAGAILKYDYRFSRYVGLSIQAAVPFPVTPSYVNTLFHVGIGLTGYLK